MKRLIVSAATIVVFAGTFASGQSPGAVRIAFDDGKVTLAATDALVSDVLAAWAEVGGTAITGVENVKAARITADYQAASELAVLDELLGATGGYITGVRSEVPPGTSLLRVIQIGKRSSKESRPVKVSRVIDMTIPESQFQYADPSPDFPDPRETADQSPQPALPPGPQIMPEMRFQYAETPLPPPPEVPVPDEQPQDKPAADTNPAPKKKPPQGP